MIEQASLKAVVSGNVQGVSFRDFTRRKAQELGLAGYVKNLPEGSVEVVASGSRSAIEKLLVHVKQGPPQARVHNVSATWGEYSNTNNIFEIRF
jgi:acylphosphatase